MNKKRIAVTTLGGLLTMSAVAAVVVSCGSTDTAAEKAKADQIDFIKDGKSVGSASIDKTIEQLTSNAVDANQIKDVLEKSISYLYEKEQKASENYRKLREESITDYAKRNNKDAKKEIEAAKIEKLETVEKITDRVKAEFEDEQDVYKKEHGHGWEATWPAELAKNTKYGGAKSDKEAIAHMVNAQLSPAAFTRFSIDQSKTWYKADLDKAIKGDKNWDWLKKLYQEGFVFSNSKNTELSKLDVNQKIIVVSTKSLDVNHKNIKDIADGYLHKFDPITVNHFLLKVTPDPKDGFKPWKIDSLDTLKSWLTTDGTKQLIESLDGFKGMHYDAAKKDFIVSDDDKALLETKVAGNSAGTKNIGGSLGLQDQLEYVSGMVPGFALPILATMGEDNIRNDKNVNNPTWMANGTNPLTGIGMKLLDKLTKSRYNDPSATFNAKYPNADIKAPETWIKSVNALIGSFSDDKKVLEIAGIVFRDQFAPKGEKKLVYTFGNNQMVVSKFGIHIINGKSIQQTASDLGKTGKTKNIDTLLEMLKSDVQRVVDGESAYFNTLSALNKNSSDRMIILEKLLKDSEFVKYLKTQDNYGADASTIKGDTYPKYSDEVITKDLPKIIEGSKVIGEVTRAKAATSKINTWMNDSYKNSTLEGVKGTTSTYDDWKKSIDDIYNTALAIAKEGATK